MLPTRPWIPSLLLPLLGACSVMPEKSYPMHADHDFVADMVADEHGRLPLPSTSRSLVIRKLQFEPEPLGERFDETSRWFVFVPGAAVTVRGSMTIYRDHDKLPTLREVLPGAKPTHAESGDTVQLP